MKYNLSYITLKSAAIVTSSSAHIVIVDRMYKNCVPFVQLSIVNLCLEMDQGVLDDV